MKKLFFIISAVGLLSSGLYAGDPNEDLKKAITKRKYDAVVAAYQSGADVNYEDVYGMNPLLYATDYTPFADLISNRSRYDAQVEQDLVDQTGKIIDFLLEKGADNTKLVTKGGTYPITRMLMSWDFVPGVFNAERFNKLMKGIDGLRVTTYAAHLIEYKLQGNVMVAHETADVRYQRALTETKDIREWLLSNPDVSMTGNEITTAQAILEDATGAKTTSDPTLMMRYYINKVAEGNNKAANLVEKYLIISDMADDFCKASGIIRYPANSETKEFNILQFNDLMEQYIDLNKREKIEKQPLTNPTALALTELVKIVNAGLFDKTDLDLIYDPSGLIEYLKDKIDKCKDPSDTKNKTAYYISVMILNEMAKAFAFDYIAVDVMIAEKIKETEMFVEEERKLDPELDKAYTRAKNSDKDLLKEAKTITKAF